MNSEQILQQNLPTSNSILEARGILPGQYSVAAFVKDDGSSGCIVSPTKGNESLFTSGVQGELIAAGFTVQITT